MLRRYVCLLAACSLVICAAVRVMAQAPAGPPKRGGSYRSGDLIELVKLDPTIKLDIRYATTNNFAGKAVYEPRAFIQRPAAEALVAAHRCLTIDPQGCPVAEAPWSIFNFLTDKGIYDFLYLSSLAMP
ncbi:MAG: D-alanyl-D-alanine dipeptidase [Syntrophorhabdus sp. PtaU1.Bin002]|nr:MAG: D-alanyl-D-alanine dipeptidase [Syntrophorhabdus sp. PtaU1.Bin002]